MAKNLLKICAASLLTGTMLAMGSGSASAFTLPEGAQIKGFPTAENPFPHAKKATPSKMAQMLAEFHFGPATSASNGARKAAPTPSLTITNDTYDFLDGPDGTTWFYTGGLITTELVHEYYTETVISGFEYTIYDSNFKKIGTVKDNFELPEDQKRVTSAHLGVTVTKNFFNSDGNYEIMISTVRNPMIGYGGIPQTDVYSIGGAKDADGTDKCIATYHGYVVDAINLPRDRFSEDFYLTFAHEVEPNIDEFENPIDYANAYALNLKTYKKGGWGEPSIISEHNIRMNCWPGNVEADVPCMFIYNGGSYVGSYGSPADVPMITYVEYEKPFWVNPLGFNPDLLPTDPNFTNIDESPTPDNNLLITTYRLDSPTSTQAKPVAEHRIATPQNPNTYATFYSIGTLDYLNDIDIEIPVGGGYGEIKGYVVRSEDMTKTEDALNICYRYYNTDGQVAYTIAENADGLMLLDDVDGRPSQAMIVYMQDNRAYFSFINTRTGEEAFAIPQQFEGHNLKVRMNRIKTGGRVLYACETLDTDYELDDNFQVVKKIVWFDENGELVRVDRLPLGEDIALSTINIMQSAISPYLFDNDDANEYMVLVKRYKNASAGSTATQEELMIIDGETGGYMLHLVPDETRGNLGIINLITHAGAPRMAVSWTLTEGTRIISTTQDFYDLPFERFSAGDGSQENPYQISSPAQLRLIADEPFAHYIITRDIDMIDMSFTPVENFRGSIDGQGHTISNLTLNSSTSEIGMFTRTTNSTAGSGAAMKNFTLLNPVLNATSIQNYAGFIVANGFNAQIENISVISGQINAEGFDGRIGAIAGQLSNGGNMKGCFVTATTINAPEATEGLGGLVGSMNVGSFVKASAFNGTITGQTYVGGIAGYMDADGEVSDCHVDADITAWNTVGGLIGYGKRSILTRNVVEGTITATTPNRFTGVLGLGGIIGELLGDYGNSVDSDSSGGSTATGAICISNNIVALEAFNYPEGSEATAHRVAGYTSEDNVDLDPNEEPLAEAGLEKNYVYDNIPMVSSSKEDKDTSVEGESISKYDIYTDFLEGLGFQFGTSLDMPWTMSNTMTPRLYFESSLTIVPSEIAAIVGEEFTVKVLVHSRKEVSVEDIAGDLSTNWDESILENTGMDFVDGALVLNFKALAEGATTIEISTLGSTVRALVTVATESAGIDNIGTDNASALSFTGSEVICEGSIIEIYSMNGTKVATGFGVVSTEGLGRGIYVASAGGSNIKIAVK